MDITIATGSTSANYYAIGNVMATVLNPVLTKGNIGVTSTGASAANVQLLQDNDCLLYTSNFHRIGRPAAGSGL